MFQAFSPVNDCFIGMLFQIWVKKTIGRDVSRYFLI